MTHRSRMEWIFIALGWIGAAIVIGPPLIRWVLES